ncbi:MAG: gluconate 2-dehydrogenase subunit 3 family protein [Gemmatimonadaceae bacterium]
MSIDDERAGATYPPGMVRRLLRTDLVTPKTREVLDGRLTAHAATAKPEPRFFSSAEFRTLESACTRLIPQPDRERPIDLAGAIDQRLAEGKTKGWRYDSMPPDGEAYRIGLRGLDETARAMFGSERDVAFDALEHLQQDAVLAAVQRGEAQGLAWQTMPAVTFLEELLTEAVECYYSHPLAEDEIGYAGFADAHGWQQIGLDSLAPFEPRALGEAAAEVSTPKASDPNGVEVDG